MTHSMVESVTYNQIQQNGNVMTEKETEWITVTQAAKRDDVPVTRQTLINMIERGDVPEDHYRIIPLANDARLIQINPDILSELPYRYQGQRGKSNASED